MASSVDGRLLADRWSAPALGLNRRSLLDHYDDIAGRIDADGWIVGRTTIEGYAKGTAQTPTAAERHPRETHVGDRRGRQVAVALDPRGRLHYGQDNAGGDHIIAVLGEQVSDDYLAELRRDGVSYLFAGPDGHDLRRAMGVLANSFGLQSLLLEGGGIVNGAFLKAGLIDEISLLVYPGIDGLSGVPSVFEYKGADDRPAAGQSLRHLASETLEGGMVWLRYAVQPAALDAANPQQPASTHEGDR